VSVQGEQEPANRPTEMQKRRVPYELHWRDGLSDLFPILQHHQVAEWHILHFSQLDERLSECPFLREPASV
jgi:hypothetical protein